MAKYHVNKKGETRECKANIESCKLDPIDTIHADTAKEAEQAYEAKMERFALKSFSKNSLTMSKSEMNKLAKTSSNYEELNQIMINGSTRALENITKNQNVSQTMLIHAAEQIDDMERRDILAKHDNFPVSSMTTEQFKKKLRSTINPTEKRKIIMSHDLTDIQAEALREGAGRPNNALRAVLRSSNHVSPAFVRSVIKSGEIEAIQILENGKLPNDMINDEHLNTRLISNGSAIHPNHTTKILDLMVKQDNVKDMLKLENNPFLSRSDIDKIVKHTDTGSLNLYKSESISEGAKKIIESRNPMALSMKKIDEMIGYDVIGDKQGMLAASLVTKNNSVKPVFNRGYTEMNFQLDKDKIKKHGFNFYDIAYLMRGQYSHSFSYNEETGIATGILDSTD